MAKLWKLSTTSRDHPPSDEFYADTLEAAWAKWYEQFGIGGQYHYIDIRYKVFEVFYGERKKYKPLSWGARLPAIPGHFAHYAEKDPTMIAYTPDENYGARGKYVILKPGRYLKKFYKYLSDSQIEYYVKWFETGNAPKVLHEVQMTKDPKKMIDIYANGPHSCMSNQQSVQVYGAGDLAIAYIEKPPGSRCPYKYAARAVVWPEKKALGRIYPNSGDFDGSHEFVRAMETHFRELGYFSVTERRSIFNGARLSKIRGSGTHLRYFMMPYLDYYGLTTHPTEPDKYWCLTNNPTITGSSNGGWMNAPPEPVRCRLCNNLFNEGNGGSFRRFLNAVEERCCAPCYRLNSREGHIRICNGSNQTILINPANPAARMIEVQDWRESGYNGTYIAHTLQVIEAWALEGKHTIVCGKAGTRWTARVECKGKIVYRLDGTKEWWSPLAFKSGGLTYRPKTVGEFYIRVDEADAWVVKAKKMRAAASAREHDPQKGGERNESLLQETPLEHLVTTVNTAWTIVGDPPQVRRVPNFNWRRIVVDLDLNIIGDVIEENPPPPPE